MMSIREYMSFIRSIPITSLLVRSGDYKLSVRETIDFMGVSVVLAYRMKGDEDGRYFYLARFTLPDPATMRLPEHVIKRMTRIKVWALQQCIEALFSDESP